MIWYCWKKGSHIVARDIEGLLIRGISEEMIFEVEAEIKLDASDTASEIIKTIKTKFNERNPNL